MLFPTPVALHGHLSLGLSLPDLPLPPPQAFMFRCSASCCEDSKASMQQVHQCIERCHAPLAQAQALVTRELENFQVRNISDRALWSLMLLFCT